MFPTTGVATGWWLHVTATGSVISGTAFGGDCLVNGEIIGTITGDAIVDGVPGFFFHVRIGDRGTPGTVIVPGMPAFQTLIASRHYRRSYTVLFDNAKP